MTTVFTSDAAACCKVLINRNCHQSEAHICLYWSLNCTSTVNTVWNAAMLWAGLWILWVGYAWKCTPSTIQSTKCRNPI